MAAPEVEIKPAAADHVEHADAEHGPDETDLKAHLPALKSDFDQLTSWQTIVRFKKAVLICTLMCIAAAADGYQINLNGNIIANSGFIRQVGTLNPATGAYALPVQATTLWGALQSLGQLIGMVLLNPVSDRIGRKYTLYLLWLILLGSIIIETTTKTWADWAGAKLLAGVGVGCLQATLPIYVTEWAPVNIRGTMILAYAIWNNIGSFLAPLMLLIVQNRDKSEWKIPVLTQWAFLGIMLPIFIWLPETASYYAARDDDEGGKAVLRRVNGGVQGYDVEGEYAVIKNIILEERNMRASQGLEGNNWRVLLDSYAECFRGSNFRRTIAASLPASVQQLTGLAFLSGYASLFFQQSGFTNSFEITTILFAVKIVSVFCFGVTTDKTGRRNVVIILGILCTTMLLVVGILGQVPKNNATKIVLIVAACFWSIGSVGLLAGLAGLTVGALGWAYVGEVSAQKLRARTAGLSAGIGVIFGLTFNTATPVMLQTNGANWGYKTAWLFLGTGIVACALAIYFLPETAKRNPAELDELYEKRIPAWRMKNYVTDVQKAQEARLGMGVELGMTSAR